MSGGHFNYIESRIQEIVSDIDDVINRNEEKDEYGHAFLFNDSTLRRFNTTAEYLTLAAKMVHEVDYLISGDTGEETFEKIWNEEILPKMAELAQKIYGNSHK